MKLQDLVKLKPIIEAIENGEPLQIKGVGGKWVDCTFSDITSVPADELVNYLRIKPEPREFFVIIEEDSSIMHRAFSVKQSGINTPTIQIKVREVIE